MTLWREDLVIFNPYSRPKLDLVGGVKGLVLHWTANKGATDEDHADFFDGSDGGGGRAAGAHLFVDQDSATLLVPLNEGTYHANDHACRIPKLRATSTSGYVGGANLTTIGVEMCVEKDGTIHADTIKRTVAIMAELCKMFKLTSEDIYRHFDVTGKNCPAPFVTNPELFTKFKADVEAILKPVVVSKYIGVVTVKTDILNVRDKADASGKIVGKLKQGETFKTYDLKMGWYNVGSGWVSGKYVTFKSI